MTLVIASRFFALLALATNLLVLVAVAAWLGAGRSGALAAARQRMADASTGSVLGLAFGVAAVATLGSLYYSEIAGLPPCELCWYQRIAMYPLAVIVGIAAVRRDVDVRRYVVPVAAIGAVIALYHYGLEWSPALDLGACTADVPCSVAWFRVFGFVSLPYMALSGFLGVAVLVGVVAPWSVTEGDPDA
jgi:disulfide bond formation protein DsbB